MPDSDDIRHLLHPDEQVHSEAKAGDARIVVTDRRVIVASEARAALDLPISDLRRIQFDIERTRPATLVIVPEIATQEPQALRSRTSRSGRWQPPLLTSPSDRVPSQSPVRPERSVLWPASSGDLPRRLLSSLRTPPRASAAHHGRRTRRPHGPVGRVRPDGGPERWGSHGSAGRPDGTGLGRSRRCRRSGPAHPWRRDQTLHRSTVRNSRGGSGRPPVAS